MADDSHGEAVRTVLSQQHEIEALTQALAEVHAENAALEDRDATLSSYIDNLMQTVHNRELPVTQRATKPKNPRSLRRLLPMASSSLGASSSALSSGPSSERTAPSR
mmetsp:Transcript_18289/g.61193  ORF Transcript_18289/g.61193 Transcript_18289/m.61193 type:complete len:107 (+) Transcript_18289:38-358(+)